MKSEEVELLVLNLAFDNPGLVIQKLEGTELSSYKIEPGLMLHILKANVY